MKWVLKIFFVLVLLISFVFGLFYYSSNANLKDLDESERANLPGEFLQTRDGVLSYTRHGDLSRPVVLLVHGFSTPKFVWDQSIEPLVEAGYQVIRFDHFGRGFSDRPNRPYDATAYRHEILDLLEGLNITEPVSLVGYSMGGANAVDFSANFPEKVNRLLLIAPAVAMEVGYERLFLDFPLIPKIVFKALVPQALPRGLQNDVDKKGAPQSIVDQFNEQIVYRGYADALFSTLKHDDVWDQAKQLEIIGQSDLPVHVLWGTDDRVVPHDGLSTVQALVPQVQAQSVVDAPHSITYTMPDITNAFLVSSLLVSASAQLDENQ